jgi:hypothetical protein
MKQIISEKLVVSQLVKKFLTLYETRGIITMFAETRHWNLSRAR